MTFANYKTIPFTVDKQVINVSEPSDTRGEFSFTANVTLNVPAGQPVPKIPENGAYTVTQENTSVRITFTLSHGESVKIPIPVNSNITVTETNKAGYRTNHQVEKGGVTGATQYGTSVTENSVNTETTVHFINQTGYELPATGGVGTHLYRLGGWLLLAIAAGWWYFKRRRLS